MGGSKYTWQEIYSHLFDKNQLASATKPSWLMNICSGVIKGLIIIFICINFLTSLKVISYC